MHSQLLSKHGATCLAIGSGVVALIGCGGQSTENLVTSAQSSAQRSPSRKGAEVRLVPRRPHTLRRSQGNVASANSATSSDRHQRSSQARKVCQQYPPKPTIEAHVFPKVALVHYALPSRAFRSRCRITFLHVAVAMGEAGRFRNLPPIAIAGPVGVIDVPNIKGGSMRLRVATENAGRVRGQPIVRWLRP
jgi:hypothetical protein